MTEKEYFVIRVIGGHIEVLTQLLATKADAMKFYECLYDKEDVQIAETIYG